MKRLTAPIAKTVLAFSLLVPAASPWAVVPAYAAESASITVSIDGKLQTFDQPPIMINNRVMVPLRGILERLGAEVEWDGDQQEVQVTKDNRAVWARIGDKHINVHYDEQEIDQPLVIHNNRTLIPVRLFSELFGAKVTWDAERKIVKIETDGVQLFEAIKQHDRQKVQQLLATGTDPNSRSFGQTALTYAYESEDVGAARALLESGALLTDDAIWTTLFGGKVEFLRLCLEFGSTQRNEEPINEKMLILATEKNHTEITKILLASGTDPNLKRARNTEGVEKVPESLLIHTLFLNHNPELTEELLKAGVDPNVALKFNDSLTYTPLQVSALFNQLSAIDLLVRYGAKVDRQDEAGWTPLMMAAETGSTDAVKALLKHRADVNLTNQGGANALMIAEAHGNTEIVTILEAAGASRNKNVVEKAALIYDYASKQEREKELAIASSPLLQAVYYGDNEQVRALLAKAAPDSEEWNRAVGLASSMANWGTIYALFANMEQGDKAGDRLLIAAAQVGNMEMARFALEHHANPDSRYWEQPLPELAASANNIELMQELLNRGASINYPESSWSPIRRAAGHGHVEMVKLILSSLKEPAHKVTAASEALLTAISTQNVAMVQLLLDMGADPNIDMKDYPMDTPLEAAKKSGIPELIALLEKAGATQ